MFVHDFLWSPTCSRVYDQEKLQDEEGDLVVFCLHCVYDRYCKDEH